MQVCQVQLRVKHQFISFKINFVNCQKAISLRPAHWVMGFIAIMLKNSNWSTKEGQQKDGNVWTEPPNQVNIFLFVLHFEMEVSRETVETGTKVNSKAKTTKIKICPTIDQPFKFWKVIVF